jgi:tetratricopeptide (TPR) repeat protein
VTTSSSPRTRIAAYVLVVAAALVCFWPAVGGEFLDWDDGYLLVHNPYYRGFDAVHLGWMFTTFHMGHYHPLTWMSFALDHALWGVDPRGYHLTNVVLHVANAALVLALASMVLARADAARANRLGAATLAALLFAVHPLRVESVAWATERRDVLSAFFLLLTTIAWLRWTDPGERARGRWYAVALLCFALSLGAKAVGMTLPAVLLVLDVWPLRRLGDPPDRRAGLRLVVEKLPFVVLALAAAVLAFRAQQASGAMATAAHVTVLQRAVQATYGLAFYVRKSILPTRLSAAYLLDEHLDPSAARYALSVLGVAAGAAVVLVLRRRWPAGVVAFVCYAILVSPVLGLTQSGIQIVADRYSYLPCLPLVLLVAAGFGRVPATTASGRALAAAALIVVAVLGVQTRRQVRVWHDSLALWDHTIAVDPENWLAYNVRGTRYEELGDLDRAVADYDVSLRLNPSYATAYNNRGHARLGQGEVDAAVDDWTRALALRPDYPEALVNRGGAYLRLGNPTAGAADLEAALATAPGLELGWYNLATAHAMLGDLDAALADVRRTLALTADPDLRARAERKLTAILEEQARRR